MWANSTAKPLFSNGSSLHIKLILSLFASLVFLGLENRGTLLSQRTPFEAIVTPVRQMVNGPARLVQKVSEMGSSQTDLIAENQQLRQEALVLKGKQLKYQALEQENTRLRGLLDSTFKVGDEVLIAEPLSINIVPYENLIVVNKGTRYGIETGQAVIDGNGVVGQVLRASQQNADIVMITDPSHAIPVQVNRNGLRTIAVGTGRTDSLELPYLTGNADVQPGDLLVTSGLGGVFPAGYPVAVVAAPPADQPGSGKYRAVPVAQLDRNRELLVVRCNSTPLPRIPDEKAGTLPKAPTHAAR